MAMKARKSGKAAAPPMKARTMNVMKAMKSGKAAAPPIKARTMNVMKAMKSGNAAAPPMKAPTMKVLKAMKVDLKKAMKAKFLQKAMKATKCFHASRRRTYLRRYKMMKRKKQLQNARARRVKHV